MALSDQAAVDNSGAVTPSCPSLPDMQLSVTVVRSDLPGAPVDLAVTAPDGTTVEQLGAKLAETLGWPAGPLRAQGRAVAATAVVGLPPVVDGAVLSMGLAPPDQPVTAPATVLTLAVVGGPDAGRTFALPPGAHTIGRSGSANLSLLDGDVSRTHAVLTVAADGIRVTDLGSTNGTRIDGRLVPPDGGRLVPGRVLSLGATRLQLRDPSVRPAATTPAGDGTIDVNRSPRVNPLRETPSVTLPAAPEPPRHARIPWLAMVLPLPICAALAAFYGPQMLLFGLMSPVLMAANAVTDRVGGRRSYAVKLAEHERHLEAAQARIRHAVADEHRRRCHDLPDASEVLRIACAPSSRLWERGRRDEDMLAVRLGTGTIPAVVRVLDAAPTHRTSHPELVATPVGARLQRIGVLGVCGPLAGQRRMARSLLGQLATLHSPLDLELWLLSSREPDRAAWQWLSRMPHCSDRAGSPGTRLAWASGAAEEVAAAVARLEALMEERRGDDGAARRSEPWLGGRVVVLLDGSRDLRGVPGLARLQQHGPSVGICFIACDGAAAELPSECAAVLRLPGAVGGAVLEVSGEEAVADLNVDLVGSWWTERLSRSLAALRDSTPADGWALPGEVRLLDLLEGAQDSVALARLWKAGGSTEAVVGLSGAGPYAVDLRRDGPHLLVGGTTGSGKSELLQTLVTSLAVASSPQDVCFVLIDYKGGSAFTECARLPHTVGLVTDLDGHLTERALTSLHAELTRRERLLSSVGARDMEEYQRIRSDGMPPIPRLVLLIDEFRVLAEELPQFLDGMIRIAAIGRSLGVHLVLATQRPGGVVSSDIRANVNLRIALRVRDRADSEDVLDSPQASSISECTPGRAIARGGSGALVTFQAARVGGAQVSAAQTLTITRVGWPPAAGIREVPATAFRRDEPSGESELALIASACWRAMGSLGMETPASPWLAPLPDVVGVESLEPVLDPSDAAEGPSSWRVPWGLVDLPESQAQQPFCWDLAKDGHWSIAGTSGTGRTTALRTIAAQIVGRFAPDVVHLYAVGTGALAALESAPHTGAVVAREDLARVRRLVDRLRREVSRRHELLAAEGVTNLREWWDRHTFGLSPRRPPAFMVLIVDDWDLLTSPSDAQDHGALTDQITALVREGEGAGLRLLVAGDRTLLLGRMASSVPNKLVLRLADPMDAAMAGLRRNAFPQRQAAGRAVRVSDAVEIQLGVLGDDASGAAQTRRLAEVAHSSGRHGRALKPSVRPLRVDRLPRRVQAKDLDCDSLGAQTLLVGAGGDASSALGLDFETDGRLLLIAGPSHSGKTTALATMARSALRLGRPVAVLTARPHTWSDIEGPGLVVTASVHDPQTLIDARRAHPNLVVMVDDADQLLGTTVEPVLREIAQLADRDGGALICSANSAALATQYKGIAVEVARRQTGLLLCPQGVADGDVFGIRTSRTSTERLPGRGLLVRRGCTVEIQVALSTDDSHLRPERSRV